MLRGPKDASLLPAEVARCLAPRPAHESAAGWASACRPLLCRPVRGSACGLECGLACRLLGRLHQFRWRWRLRLSGGASVARSLRTRGTRGAKIYGLALISARYSLREWRRVGVLISPLRRCRPTQPLTRSPSPWSRASASSSSHSHSGWPRGLGLALREPCGGSTPSSFARFACSCSSPGSSSPTLCTCAAGRVCGPRAASGT